MNSTPDFSVYRDGCDDDEDFYDSSLSLADNLKAAFRQVVRLPDQNIQLPIVIAYTLIPSALATVVPILALLGAKGSGKSTAIKLMAAVHKQTILSAATSPVAIRNHINQSKWINAQELEGEKNALLLFDNVTADAFKDDFLYLYFLNGYDRATDTVMISAGGSKNHVFKVFGLKVISTVHSFLGERRFEELARRCIVIRFKPLEQLAQEGKGVVNSIPIETLNLTFFKERYDEFWRQTENLESFATHKRKLLRLGKKSGLPVGFSSSKWIISVDLLATGCTTNMWDVESGLATLNRYWEWFEQEGKPGLSPLQMLLTQLIKEEVAKIDDVNEQHGEGTCDMEISPKAVKKAVQDAASKGQLDTDGRACNIADTMRSLGWNLKMSRDNKLTWQPDN